VFLLNSRLGHFSAATHSVAFLLPKLRNYFAEFLSRGSPERLRILSSPICVDLRYGPLYSLFLGRDFMASLCPKARLNVLIRQYVTTTSLRHFYCIAGDGILTILPSEVAFRLVLRIRLTLIRLTLIRNP